MDAKKKTAAVAIALIVAGVAWASGLFRGVDPEVAELERLRDERFAQREQMNDEQRRAARDEMRSRIDGLSEQQKKEFRQRSAPMFQQMMQERMNAFFEMTPEQQRERLDELIDRQQERQQNRGARQGGGGDDRPQRSQADRDQRRKEMLDMTTPAMRSSMDRFKDMMNERRQERGLDPVDGFRGMFGPRRGPPGR